ncbi:acyl-CoA carboxylase epsilon subunit-like protein [Jatrophihabitans sp. GAS493]|uniref:acyl-CoA carboxylase subunit epsilon n=1 Tax=Jatrophihabitans sp. GAS493 TaxID=1907575 RepID=UPI000BC04410|nr:acyl-CoA carboxylase subunit epsilon [Jatrophihabitans sp. GAS493]SOD72052.1 acyl-CoA carboxylase epsilon subunit-like protein [Jatrophihabitans sp. GAS493]
MSKHRAPDADEVAESSTPEAEVASARPVLRIVKGEPTPEELAVVTALFSARGSAEPAEPKQSRAGGWADPAQLTRPPLRAGAGAWRNAR